MCKPSFLKVSSFINPLEQRVAKEVDGVITEKYLWANLTTLLATYDKDNNLVQRFNYADARMPISMTQDNQTYYLHYDQVGTLRVVTDADHNIIKEITYDTFGNILQDTNKNLNIPFGFAGGLHDTDTNLVRFGYREYDPQTGKWTAKDPIGFDGGDANLYGYVLEDPVNKIDPLGLWDDPRFKRTLPNLGKPLISPDSTLEKIAHGFGRDIPKAFKGFANGLKRLDNYADTCQDDSLSSSLFNYLYLSGQRNINESEAPINLIDKISTYNTINDAVSGDNK